MFKQNISRNSFVVKTFWGVFVLAFVCAFSIYGQEIETVVVVQPGSPGQATKVLPSDTKAKLTPFSMKDVEFMQGMIHHHSQAVEMVALMKGRTTNDELLRLGSRIAHTQADEIEMMKRWLNNRGQKLSMEMPKMKPDEMKMKSDKMKDMDDDEMSEHHHHDSSEEHLMHGMLSAEQMKALANAKGAEFDKLFLTGMIQHHAGALVMVDELFKTVGAGQDAEVFNFATDVDSSQRAEIKIMQTMLGKKS